MKARRRSARHAVASVLPLALAGCEHGGAPSPAMHLDGVHSCEYHVRVERSAPLTLAIDADCEGRGVRGLEADDEDLAARVTPVSSDESVVSRRGSAFVLDRPQHRAHFHYRIDLDRLAAEQNNSDVALRSGRSLLAPASSYLLYPLPLDVGIGVKVYVETPKELAFTSGLTREGDHYRLEAHEIPVATYSVFGAAATRRLPLGDGPNGAEIELAVLDGKLSVDVDALSNWVTSRARAVADFYHGFPAPRATVMVLPVPKRRDVVFGKLLPESAPGIVLLVGGDAEESALAGDWVLVHELFHIGVPSFSREGKWFDEGLATYFEPLIRVRAGFWNAESAWQSFALEMPQGLAALTRRGLEHAKDYRSIYWGGALYCLLADVEAREGSAGRLGLEDGIRGVFAAGGHSWDVWSLADTLRRADASYASPLLAPLAARYANQPAPLDLDALFTSLGIERKASGITLSDAAPRAWVRQAIMSGARATPTEAGARGAQLARRK
jgi:hypothetical protein